MKSVLILIDSVVSIYIWILIINALFSWLVTFNVLNTSNRLVYSLLNISYKMTDPLLRPIRNFLPNLGGIDISPIILILLLMFLRNLVFEFFAPWASSEHVSKITKAPKSGRKVRKDKIGRLFNIL